MQQKLYTIAKQVAHDICSPISSLKMVQYVSAGKLSEKENKMLELSIKSIEDIAKKLIDRYKGIKNKESDKENHFIVNKTEDQSLFSPYLSLREICESKQYQYQNPNITITFSPNSDDESVNIKRNPSDFSRMMSNLINNAIEAVYEKKDIIDIIYTVKNNKVEIIVKDNGSGMPKEIIDKIMKNIEVGSTKENGHGIGMLQIQSTLKSMNAQMLIKSEENVGTEFILTFQIKNHIK